jgi:hypothetical protein
MQTSNFYGTKFKNFEKKMPDELKAMMVNLNKFFQALNKGANPFQITSGYLHKKYPRGIQSIDQKGMRGNLRQTRLYVFPDENKKRLHLLTIGDKGSQKNDVRECVEYVDSLKSITT